MAEGSSVSTIIVSKRDQILQSWKDESLAAAGPIYKADSSLWPKVQRAGGATLDTLVGCLDILGSALPDPHEYSQEGLSHWGLQPDSVNQLGLLWSDLAFQWPEVQRLIRLLTSSIDRALASVDVVSTTRCVCSRFITDIANEACSLRVRALDLELTEVREQTVLTHQFASRFIANASHELRTPLTAILGFSELLSEHEYGEMNESQLMALGHIYNSAQNLLEIINDLIDVMQLQAGKLTLKCKRTEIYPMLASVYDILSALAQRRQVELKLEMEPTLGHINMDETIVRHIVYHLLASALRSTPTGGIVSLSAARTDTALTIITYDTALHLPEGIIDSFNGAVQVKENMPDRGYDMWQVGLAMVKKYVDLQRGSMQVENRSPEEGGGTAFRVTIPANLTATA